MADTGSLGIRLIAVRWLVPTDEKGRWKMAAIGKPKLPWYQFSLRSLLLFTVVASVFLSPIGWYIRQRRAFSNAAAPFEQLGGAVLGRHSWHDGAQGVVYVYFEGTGLKDAELGRLQEHMQSLSNLRDLCLRNTNITDRGLAHLKGLRSLVSLDLSNTQVTDAGLEHLKKLPNLETLTLSNTQVTDVGLECLKEFPSLDSLYLGGTQVTDAGLRHLKELSRLYSLSLGGTQVTDAGLRHLKELSRLYSLSLRDTQVTDAGLEQLSMSPALRDLDLENTQVTDTGMEHLTKLPKLRSLDLEGTEVTDQGIARIRQACPKCDIHCPNSTWLWNTDVRSVPKMSDAERTDQELFVALEELKAGKLAIKHVADEFGFPIYDTQSPTPPMPIEVIGFAESEHGNELPEFRGASRVMYWKSPFQPGNNVEVLGLIYDRDGLVDVFRAQVLPP